jgi:hypothetical protein
LAFLNIRRKWLRIAVSQGATMARFATGMNYGDFVTSAVKAVVPGAASIS